MAAVLVSSLQTAIKNQETDSDSYLSDRAPPNIDMASELLIDQMCSVLTVGGYGRDAIEKVATRVSSNVVETRDITVEDASLKTFDLIGQLLDQDVLNSESLERKSIYLNSNEPVVLLEVPKTSKFNQSELSAIKESFLGLLRDRTIRPVRVYVRVVDGLLPTKFGFCLLNVVNTDIGGPSMIQLLDAAFHEDWKEHLILKEAFDGMALLWRDEAVPYEPEKSDLAASDVSSALQEDVLDKSGEGCEQKSPEVDTDLQQADMHEQPHNEPFQDITEVPVEFEERGHSRDSVEHPQMVELRRRESARAEVIHPTWSHEHDEEGLLDIITYHSASVKDVDHISTVTARVDTESDDFELVEVTSKLQ